jgi:hypothetical protein
MSIYKPLFQTGTHQLKLVAFILKKQHDSNKPDT